jgi:hypothetical protein
MCGLTCGNCGVSLLAFLQLAVQRCAAVLLVLPAGRPGLAHGVMQGWTLCRRSAAGVLCIPAVQVQQSGVAAGRKLRHGS